MNSCHRIVSLLFAMLIAFPVVADPRADFAGRVVGIDGDPAAIAVVREDNARQPQVGMAVFAQDRIEVSSASGKLRLKMANETVRELTAGVTVIEPPQPPQGMSEKLWTWATDSLGRLELGARTNDARTVGAYTRGGALSAPLISGPKTRMLAERQGLHFAWHGGIPPYEVSISAEKGEEVLRVHSLAEPRLNAPQVRLAAGFYRILLKDSCNPSDIDCRPVDQWIEVLPSSSLPSPPPGVKALGTPASDVERVIQFLWLASLDDMAWGLEVYQCLADEAADGTLGKLRAALVAGEALPSPP